MTSIPTDGRMTSFDSVPATLAGDELLWVVQPGNVATGVLYKSTLATMSKYASAFPYLNSTIITAGATYASCDTDTVILVNKTVGSSTTITLLQAAAMLYAGPVLIKDLKGDAGSNNIVINFTGENCDGASSITIAVNYGFCFIVPVPGGGAWYMTARLLV